jgi:hypothetical protein
MNAWFEGLQLANVLKYVHSDVIDSCFRAYIPHGLVFRKTYTISSTWGSSR